MAAPKRHLLLVNPSAGGGRTSEILPRVEHALNERGLQYELVLTTGIEHGCEQAVAAAGRGEIPVVVSGDGLIGQVGGALAGTAAVIGVIPGGRGNDLARVLGIPVEPEAAVEVLATGRAREIDVGDIDGQRFLGIASCGFDSDANRIANEAKWIRGSLVYLYAALRALWDWKPATFTLSLDGERHELSGYSVGAANSRAYGGGMYAAPDAELDDGLLDVVTIRDMRKLRFLATVLPRVFKGTHIELPEVSSYRATTVRIGADRPFALYADGDHLADLPVTIRLLPRALRVLVPR